MAETLINVNVKIPTTVDDTIALKPCAHCNSSDVRVSISGNSGFVYCGNPDCGIYTRSADDLTALADLWNTRAHEPA